MLKSIGIKGKRRMNLCEKMLYLGLALSPFTALRFSLIGISEILFIGFIIYSIYINRFKIEVGANRISTFYIYFIFLSLIGWGYNTIFGYNSGTTYSALYNLFSYLFVGILLIQTENDCSKRAVNLELVISHYFYTLSIVAIVLYIVSLFRSTFLGFQLKYFQYYSPLSDNIHQLGMLIVSLPFIGMELLRNETSKLKKNLVIILIVIDLYLGYRTGAIKVIIGFLCGLSSIFLLLIFNKRLKGRNVFAVIIVFFVVAVYIINISTINGFFNMIFDENDLHGGRRFLYKQAIDIILEKAYIFGLGPSSHVMLGNQVFDAHETFLTAALSAGIPGSLLIAILIYRCIKQSISNSCYVGAMMATFIYILGGDLLRKPAIWELLILMAYISSHKMSENDMKCSAKDSI